MSLFVGFPTYDTFRTLRLKSPHQHGEDVFALQTALLGIGVPLPRFGADGDLGTETSDGILAAQRLLGLTVDGLAGGKTQQALALRCGDSVQLELGLPGGALKGQLEHESSFRLGAYSALRSDGSYDAGVTQRNTKLTPAKEGFTVPDSIRALGARIRQHHTLFAGVPSARRWALAQGSWNAPAFACFIAREEGATGVKSSQCLEPTPTQRTTFEAYVTAVSKYVS